MTILSQDKKSKISLEFLESETERYPSVCLEISIQDRKFSGYNKDVWFELAALKGFVADLKQLEQTRIGSVSLTSMSPEEFHLKIETYDLCGHMVLKYAISKSHYIPQLNIQTLSGGFEIDVSLLNILSVNFENRLFLY